MNTVELQVCIFLENIHSNKEKEKKRTSQNSSPGSTGEKQKYTNSTIHEIRLRSNQADMRQNLSWKWTAETDRMCGM